MARSTNVYHLQSFQDNPDLMDDGHYETGA
jgi:hypothetical protein